MTLIEQYENQLKIYQEMYKVMDSEEYKEKLNRDIKRVSEKIHALKFKSY